MFEDLQADRGADEDFTFGAILVHLLTHRIA